jgi:pimeloyl-ACP methyl ester carboxylesterase
MSAVLTGSGPLLVLIPGIQGRWEWMAPAIRSLAGHFTVATFSLGDVSGPGLFDRWTDRIDDLLSRSGQASATVLGVSFGGLVAAYYAAKRPERTAALVIVSAPSPSWRLDPRSAGYVRYPRLALPVFASRAVRRLLPEVNAAIPGLAGRVRFCAGYALRSLRFPVSPRQMANVVREWERTDLERVVRGVNAPTLIVTGEQALDRVVPVQNTKEFLTLIPGARLATIAHTGHVGLLSKPQEFCAIVAAFVDDASRRTRAAAGG